MNAPALGALHQLLASDTDADDILRSVVDLLVTQGGCRSAAIEFSEAGSLVTGPQAGTTDTSVTPSTTPVDFQGTNIARLATTGCDDNDFLDQVATLIAPYCLVGWDTDGIPWDTSAPEG